MRATMDIFRIVRVEMSSTAKDWPISVRKSCRGPVWWRKVSRIPRSRCPSSINVAELISTKDKLSPVTIKGSNFTKGSFVLFNDQIVRGTVQGDNELKINIPPGLVKAAGVYPLVVVEPGSAGGVSNTFYFMVTTRSVP